jgi:hypothetical protein
MSLLSSQRFYALYSGILTAALVVILFTGFDLSGRHQKLKVRELTVQRINIIEPDGTLRMVISNKARAPGIYIKNKERLEGHHGNTAGLLFMNDEGTETGGLTFSGYRDADGNARTSGHLAFDRYMQDQVITFSAQQVNDQRSTQVNMLDQPAWPITDYLDLIDRIEDLPPAEQQAAIAEFLSTHESGASRLSLSRRPDRSVGLELKDTAGRPRAILKVDADGTPRLQFLDEQGNLLAQFPEN